jgi:hypothetical protein
VVPAGAWSFTLRPTGGRLWQGGQLRELRDHPLALIGGINRCLHPPQALGAVACGVEPGHARPQDRELSSQFARQSMYLFIPANHHRV